MTLYEKSAIIGYARNGASWAEIGFIMGISPEYAKIIFDEYIKSKKK